MTHTISISKKELEDIFDSKLKPIGDTTAEMNESMKFLNTSFEEIKTKVGNLENRLDDVVKENNFLKKESSRLSKENTNLANLTNNLSRDLNDIQQYLRRDCCEITGLPVVHGENTNDLVKRVGLLMDLELQDDDISVSHRLPKNEASYSSRLNDGTVSSGRIVDKALQFPKIIVKFVKRDTKELFYKSRKKLSGKTTKDIDLGRISDNNIYISESLTAKNRVLFKECLKFRRNYKFKFIWTNQGRVYMRRDKDSPSKIISCQADLEGLLEMR